VLEERKINNRQQLLNQVKFDKIRYFNEKPWWWKTSILVPTVLAAVPTVLATVPTVLAAVTNPAERPALAQQGAVNTEWSLVILEGTRRQTVLSLEGKVILLTKTLIRNRASRLRRPK
jgi:hypothetical protein